MSAQADALATLRQPDVATLKAQRDAAMHRARWVRTYGFKGLATDVMIARHFNRMLLSAMRMRA